MRILNTPVSIPQFPDIKDYFGLINVSLDAPPAGGFEPSEMVRRYRISDKLKGDYIEVDSDELEKIKECVAKTPWAFRSKIIIQFSDYIKGL